MAKNNHRNGLDFRGSRDKLTDNGKSGLYGSEAEVNGNAIPPEERVDKYGFTGGAQQSPTDP